MRFRLRILFITLGAFVSLNAVAQGATVSGVVSDDQGPIPFANVYLKDINRGTTTDQQGMFTLENVEAGSYSLVASYVSYKSSVEKIVVPANGKVFVEMNLNPVENQMEQVVISGTMKPISKLDSPVPVEVYTPAFFKSNPTPSVYEAMQNVNGVRPQVNCSVCNTGDIHINGLEGAYTMVLIDGMPIVSGLSTVYGLNGIPQALIERVEVVKGPASTLYGSEAVGGLINVITKKTINAPIISADIFATSWGEVNSDVASKFTLGQKAESLLGINYFNFGQRIDNDEDNFTDVTLQDRISVFNKWNFKRADNKIFTLAGRYVYEDRFGGDVDWTAENRGGDEIYGESIYTSRWEFFGTYQLPVKERMLLQFSANGHNQNSVYGDTPYLADQKIAFGQYTWSKKVGSRHEILMGASMRYTYYDDNTPATSMVEQEAIKNAPTHTYLPGLFVQDELLLNENNKLLVGLRFDRNNLHGNILTPRLNYKWNSPNKLNTIRFSLGSGYRVANVFTEDHAALTGSRELVFVSDLNPETSLNANLNYVKKIYTTTDLALGIDASLFYTYFDNKIFADYDTDPGSIIYDNLSGFAVSNGLSLNADVAYKNFKMVAGFTLMDVYSVEGGVRERQELTERFSGTWTLSYAFHEIGLSFDYTGSIYSPMELPTLDTEDFDDPRPSQSPWWSIQNLQITKEVGNQFEVYGGVKNLLNWTPWRNLNAPYLGNTADPFEQNTSPGTLVFDPAYVYGPNQGIRGFLGFRYIFE